MKCMALLRNGKELSNEEEDYSTLHYIHYLPVSMTSSPPPPPRPPHLSPCLMVVTFCGAYDNILHGLSLSTCYSVLAAP